MADRNWGMSVWHAVVEAAVGEVMLVRNLEDMDRYILWEGVDGG